MRSLLGLLTVVLPLASCDSETTPKTSVDGPPPICSAGATRCDGDAVETCASDGQGWQREDCRALLGSDGTCVVEGRQASCRLVVCRPMTTRCATDGLTVERCDKLGQGYATDETCDPAKGTLCVGGSCQRPCQLEAGKPQNVGCLFLPVYLDNNRQDKLGIVVSNPNAFPSTVTLADKNGQRELQVVPPGGLVTLLVPPSLQVLTGSGHGYDLAFSLEASLPVAAYQFNPLDKAEQRSNDASLLLPTATWGKRYIALTGPVTSAGATYVTVVGLEDNTQLTITPTAAIQPQGTLTSGIAAGATYITSLGARDLFQVATTEKDADLTGTLVEADKPVAVFAGNGCLYLPAMTTFCDHIEEQQLPVETWGKRYAAVKFQPRGATVEDDWWGVIASEDDTVVTLAGAAGLPTVPKLAAGQSFWIKTPASFTVEADKPIALGHYMLSQAAVTPPLAPGYDEPFETPADCAQGGANATNMGDPALSLAVPIEQYRDRYIFLVPDTYRYDFLSVAVETKANTVPTFELDGEPLTLKLEPVGSTDLAVARLRIKDGAHTISANLPFGIEVHGYDCNVSYAYGGGLKLEKINVPQ
jgi:hypothetical protein